MPNQTTVSFITGLLLVTTFHLSAQDLQLAGFSFTRFPGVAVEDSPVSREIEVNEYNFFLNVPKRLKNERTVLVNGFRYKLVTPSANNDANINIDDQKLHVLGYNFTLIHQLKNKWSALVLLSPSLSSTFNQPLEGDDFLMTGMLQFKKKKSEKFSYGVGVLATSRFGDPIILPAVQLTWETDKRKLNVLLPNNISYIYFMGKLKAGVQLAVDGSLYNVNYSRTSMLNEVQPVDKLSYTRIVLGPKLSYRLGKVIQLEISGGVAAAQRIELQGNLFEDEAFNLENGTFLQLGIAMIPPKIE